MRNGNYHKRNQKATGNFLVLTVPMRNGNAVFHFRLRIVSLSSYRTYEEWKLLIPREILRIRTFVLTVPMRNGNYCKGLLEDVKYTVLTVPMRNGNRRN